jgi:hypothetical protein
MEQLPQHNTEATETFKTYYYKHGAMQDATSEGRENTEHCIRFHPNKIKKTWVDQTLFADFL